MKPKLFLDRGRFEMAEGQGFFLSRDDGSISVEPRAGFEGEVLRLTDLLNDPEQGIPLSPAEL